MRITNRTSIPTALVVSEAPGEPIRIGMLTAKATFCFDTKGRVEPDTQSPLPLFAKDEETPLGILPSDRPMRRGPAFEVMLLGCAHPPRRPSVATEVALTVGQERRQLLVWGDRVWMGDRQPSISQPIPFERMPLVYERAFGGKASVEIDAQSFIDVQHAVNPRGKGWDARSEAHLLAQQLKAPKGYPILPDTPRPLPNIEDPRWPVRRWEDTPDPAGWGPTPLDTAIAQLPLIRRESAKLAQAKGRPGFDAETVATSWADDGDDDPDRCLYRAHPDWIIPRPLPGATISLENLLPDCKQVTFALPPLRIVADYTIDGRMGKRDLIPQALVLLPEEKRFYLVYRMPFTFAPQPGGDRAFRIRIERGWLADHA